MPVFKIQHTTRYEYDRLVQESCNEVRIYPYRAPEQETLQHQLTISGNPPVDVFTDYWGNTTGTFNLMPPHRELVIQSQLVVRTLSEDQPVIDFSAGTDAMHRDTAASLKLIEFAKADRIAGQDAIDSMLVSLSDPAQGIAGILERCSRFVFENFKYIKGITTVETTVDEILGKRAGVCQDFAHLLLQMLRTLQIPARYVSGYICPNRNGMRGEGATHAWVEAWIPGSGWTGIDPTNNVWVTNRHVRLAVGRNFADCSPVKGTFRGPAVQQLSVYVSVGYEDGQVSADSNEVVQKQPSAPALPVEQPQQ